MSETKLKPCPFCGGEAIQETKIDFVPSLMCCKCGARMIIPMDFKGDYRIELANKWNTRKPMDNIVAELEKESDFFGGEPMGSLQKAYYCKGVEKAIDILRKGGME